MGILDTVIGSLFGSSNASPGMSSVLSDILGGNQAGAAPGYNPSGVPGGGQSGNVQGTSDGLGSLISMFEGAGLGHIVQSWIGNGANSPVSPADLQNVFGERVPGMAQQAGMPQGDFLDQLSQHLPNAVDGMTPNGQAPTNASVDV